MYPPGTKVECINMKDEKPVPPGTKGIVQKVDDMGQIHVRWENGSHLALIPGTDDFSKVPPKKRFPEHMRNKHRYTGEEK